MNQKKKPIAHTTKNNNQNMAHNFDIENSHGASIDQVARGKKQ